MAADGLLDDYEDLPAQLFAVLVAGVDWYVREICAREADSDAGSLATVATDRAALADPASFRDMDTFRYRHHLMFTLSGLNENLGA